MSEPASPEAWPLEESEIEYECSIFTVRRDRARSPRTGETHDFIVVSPSQAVAVLALTPDGELVLVEQFRHGIRENTLELPGGILHGDGPLDAARRELREETGYEGAELSLIGAVDLNPSWETTRVHFVLATGAAPAGDKDEDEGEDTRVRRLPLDRARRWVVEGKIRNAVTITGLYLLEAGR